MTEKYDVVDLRLRAGGVEYPTHDGFGWTNGVALALARGVLQHSAVPSPGFSLGNQSALGLSRSSTYAVVISAAWDNPCGKLPSCSDRKSTRLNSSHDQISYAVFCLKKKKKNKQM